MSLLVLSDKNDTNKCTIFIERQQILDLNFTYILRIQLGMITPGFIGAYIKNIGILSWGSGLLGLILQDGVSG